MRIIHKQPRNKPKSLTKSQRRAQWEQIVIAGGVVRASKMQRTAGILNRGRGALVRILAVPLHDDRQLQFLEQMADEGICGQTPEECAAFLITNGIIERITHEKI